MSALTAVGLLMLGTLVLRWRAGAAKRAGRHAAGVAAILLAVAAICALYGDHGLAGSLGIGAALLALSGVATAVACQQAGSAPGLLTAMACLAVAVGLLA